MIRLIRVVLVFAMCAGVVAVAAPAGAAVSATLPSGAVLPAGGTLQSTNGRFTVAMQTDGNLVLYSQAGRALWASGTAGNPGSLLAMQTDGNMVVYSQAGRALWSSGSAGNSGASAVIQDDGNFVVYTAGGQPRWSSGTAGAAPAPPPVGGGGPILESGYQLPPGDALVSADGRFILAMQGDGNLVLYIPGGAPAWQSGTSGNPGAFAVMQPDGNLVIYTTAGQPRWSSGTSGRNGAFLVLQNDANAVVYTAGGAAVWQSGTGSVPLPLSDVVQLAAGPGTTACAVIADGTARCWGLNRTGEVGNGTTTVTPIATTVTGLSGVEMIATSSAGVSCAVVAGGAVRCWGNNSNGALGGPTTELCVDGSEACATTPLPAVADLPAASSVATSNNAACALLVDQRVACWGLAGENGTATNSLTPVYPTLPGPVAQLSAGTNQICVVLVDHQVFCWGLGYTTPLPVVGYSAQVESISVHASHVCAIVAGGGVDCFGYNDWGELGNGTYQNSAAPVRVVDASGTPITGMAQVTVGSDHTCALPAGTARRTLKCWGWNAAGQFGIGGSLQSSNVAIDGATVRSGVQSISAGSYSTCAVDDQQLVSCWGSNYYGELGNGTGNPAPVRTPGLVLTRA